MIGNGTEANPYLIFTPYDLKAALEADYPPDLIEYRYYKHLSFQNDIDFNDYPDITPLPYRYFRSNHNGYWEGFTYVHGNGYKIKNLFMGANVDSTQLFQIDEKNTTIFESFSLIEITIVNSVTNGSFWLFGYNRNYSTYYNFVDCVFNIKYYGYNSSNSDENNQVFRKGNITNCVINFELYYNNLSANFGLCRDTLIKYSTINMKLIYTGLTDIGNSKKQYVTRGAVENMVDHCTVFMTTVNTHANGGILQTQDSRYNVFKDCFFVFKNGETANPDYKAFCLAFWYDTDGYSTGVNGTCAYDADVIDPNDVVVSNVSGTLLACTTAQSKDAAYLASQGFDISTS